MSTMHPDVSDGLWPRLIADIGGTNARFALETAPQQFEQIDVLPTEDYDTVVDAAKEYLRRAGQPAVRDAAFAIANPIVGDWVQMTNHHWAFSIEATRQALDLRHLLLLNDFTAQALAMNHVHADEQIQIGGGSAVAGAPKAVLGPGTGLGVSGLIPDGRGGYTALAGEGGHVSFSPFDDTETAVWQYAKARFGHVSAERFLSGSGLVLIYQALAAREGLTLQALTPAEVSSRGLSGTDPLARQTLDVFCAMLGTVSSNLALTLGARGGVYLVGGILPRIMDYFPDSPFRSRFESKGRFGAYLASVPTYVVLAPYPGISGAAAGLADHLARNGR